MLMPCLTPNRRSKGRHAYSLIAFTHRTSDSPVEHRGLPREPLPTLHGHIGHTRVQLDAVADSPVTSAAISVVPERINGS